MNANKCLTMAGILAAVALICFAGERPAESEQKNVQALAEGNNQFALDLYAKLRSNEGNLFFSPYSISTALAMTYSGARGATAAQMAQVLHFPAEDDKQLDSDYQGRGPSRGERRLLSNERIAAAFGELQKGLKAEAEKKGYELSVANALWGQKGYDFLDGFLEVVEANYGGRLSEVDFVAATEKARTTINAWVEKKTKGKIKELIKPGVVNGMTRLVLTNAIYFKGAWAAPFEEAATHPGPFTLADGKKVDIPMMNLSDNFKYAEAESAQILELPYADDELSMIILLPKKTDGLSDFEKELTPRGLSDWLGGLAKRKVVVSIPKFKMTSQFSMASVLKSMGITDAFAPREADFSGMNGRKDLFISAVVHEAYVEVNEEGTEAAAATGVVMRLTSVPMDRPPVFRADHPFLFVIRHKQTGSILFIGRVTNPKA
ncbi:MAG: serpin family protein [Sedimentisphaerales bacterium]|nr:serpin family protein [Sedimentisphaerales bacterium]